MARVQRRIVVMVTEKQRPLQEEDTETETKNFRLGL